MTAEEKGHYITLLCYQQQYGGLSEAVIRKILNGSYAEIWPQIASKFEQDEEGNFFNKRMRQEINRRKKYTESRRNNGKSTAYAKHMDEHMEIRNSNSNKEFRKEEGKGEENPLPNAEAPTESKPPAAEPRPYLAGKNCYNVEETVLANQIEFQSICMGSNVDEHFARDSLRKYHLWNEREERYPISKTQAFSGFRLWLMNEKSKVNGKNQQSPAKAGTSEARTTALKNWSIGGGSKISAGTD